MLNALGRIINSIRGSVNNAAEAVADANAIPALQQNIRDANVKLEKSKDDLSGLVAKVKMAERKLATIEEAIASDEATAQRAVDQGKDDIALKVLNRIAAARLEADKERKSINDMKAASVNLHGVISSLSDQIKSVERQISQVEVTETVLSAQDAILSSGAGASGSINNASDALRRIQEQQEARREKAEARMQLSDMTSGGDLDRQLAEEGLLGGPATGKALLEEMKAKRAAALAAPDATKALAAPEGEKA